MCFPVFKGSSYQIPFYIQHVYKSIKHYGRVAHICASTQGHRWSIQWLVASSAPSPYLNQCCLTVDWTTVNNCRWKRSFCFDVQKWISKCRLLKWPLLDLHQHIHVLWIIYKLQLCTVFVNPGACCNIGYPSKTHFELRSRKISFFHSSCVSHGSVTAALSAKFQNNLSFKK